MKFRNIIQDFVSLGLTVLAVILHSVGLFVGPWWVHQGTGGLQSEFGILTLKICQYSCVDRGVLVLEGGREWVVTVRIFEIFGEVFLLVALIMVVLAVIVRLRYIHTSVIYLHAAAALFILVGILIFAGFKSQLSSDLKGEASTEYPLAMSVLGAVVCVIASIVSGHGLRTHLLHLEDWDDDEDIVIT